MCNITGLFPKFIWVFWYCLTDKPAWTFRPTQYCQVGFPAGSDNKKSPCNAGDTGLIPGLERSPGEENGNSLQHSCLKNSMDRGAWRATVHGVTKSRTWLSKQHTLTQYCHLREKAVSSIYWFMKLKQNFVSTRNVSYKSLQEMNCSVPQFTWLSFISNFLPLTMEKREFGDQKVKKEEKDRGRKNRK